MSALPESGEEARSAGPAILAMCFGVLCLVANDGMAKWLTTHYAPLQIVFLRNLLALPMIAAIVLSIGGWAALRTHHLRIHAWRGLLLVGGAYSFFVGLKFLRSEEHTSELQSLMRISYAVFCLKKKKKHHLT